MCKRTRVLLLVVLGLAFVPFVTGCGDAVDGERYNTAGSGSLATKVAVDLGSSGLPIVPQKVAVADSAKTFVPPAALPLYEKVIEQPLTTESMQELAGKLGLTGVAFAARGFQNGDYAVEFPGGDEVTCFTITRIKSVGDYATLIEQGKGDEIPLFPSDSELRKMADQYLRQLGLGTGLESTTVFVQESMTAGAGSSAVTYDLSKGVGYRMTIDDLPLLGPGAKVYITFGPRTELLRMAHWVMPHRKGPDVRIRQSQDALADIAAGKGLPPGNFTPESAREITVTGATLAYWAEPLPMQERYYKPVYVFSVTDNRGQSGPWIVPAFDAASD